MAIEDEEITIPPAMWRRSAKSTEQRVREGREKYRDRIRAYQKEYKKKNKLKLQKIKHDWYIRTLKKSKLDRILRYHNDPEWREQVKAYNRERYYKKKAERLAKLSDSDSDTKQNEDLKNVN